MTIIMAVMLALAPAPPVIEAPPLVELGPITSAATVDISATRGTTDSPATTATDPPDQPPPGLSNCDEMSWYRQDAGLPARFDAIGWRESNCRNEEGVHTSCCWGYWQLNVGVHLRDPRIAPRYHACGVSSRFDVDSDTPGDKRRQACAAKALFDVVGYSAW